jgi:hypothetical protein
MANKKLWVFILKILVKQSVAASQEALLKTLLAHEQLDRFFNGRFCFVHSQDKNEIKGGKGCVREIKTAGLTFQEQIVKANIEGIQYKIIGDFFLKKHFGRIAFSPIINRSGVYTNVEYSITFHVSWYLPSRLIKYFVERDITKAMQKLKRHFDES